RKELSVVAPEDLVCPQPLRLRIDRLHVPPMRGELGVLRLAKLLSGRAGMSELRKLVQDRGLRGVGPLVGRNRDRELDQSRIETLRAQGAAHVDREAILIHQTPVESGRLTRSEDVDQ